MLLQHSLQICLATPVNRRLLPATLHSLHQLLSHDFSLIFPLAEAVEGLNYSGGGARQLLFSRVELPFPITTNATAQPIIWQCTPISSASPKNLLSFLLKNDLFFLLPEADGELFALFQDILGFFSLIIIRKQILSFVNGYLSLHDLILRKISQAVILHHFL